MALPRKILVYILSIGLGVVFLLSGIGKLLDINQFIWLIRDFGIESAFLAGFLARGLIALELVLGLFLIFQFALRRFTLPLVALTLILFSAYLFYLMSRQGAEADCGCFGALGEMGTLAALIKNGIMMLAAIGLFIVAPSRLLMLKPSTGISLLAKVLVVAAITVPFILPARYHLDLLYKADNTPHPVINLKEGKFILGYLSATCSHCHHAAERLKELHDSDATIPVYLVIWGQEDAQQDFLKETNTSELPHLLFTNKEAFIKLAGPFVPVIMLLNDSHIDQKVYYTDLRLKNIQQWMKSN